MVKSKPEDRLPYLTGDPNPYCPVCGEGKAGEVQHQDTVTDGRPVAGHHCLLSICNEFYALSRFNDS